MYVRLAFAVAAHLEPEILIVDEVLAVGDAEFQNRCIGKMKGVAENGRTVLVVTHQLGIAFQIARRCVLMETGIVKHVGEAREVISEYLRELRKTASGLELKGKFVRTCGCVDDEGEYTTSFSHDQDVALTMHLDESCFTQDMYLGISLKDLQDRRVFSDRMTFGCVAPSNRVVYRIPALFLAPGTYSFLIVVHSAGGVVHELHDNVSVFTVADFGSRLAEFEGEDYGCVMCPGKWIL